MITTLKSTSRRQVRFGDERCGGSLSANLRVDGQKQHIRPNFGASKHNIAMPIRIKEDGKCCDCVGKVHAITRGDLLDMRFPKGSKRLEDRRKRNTLLLSAIGFKRLEDRGKRKTLLLSPMRISALGGNIQGDEAEVSRGRDNLIDEIEGLSAVPTVRCL